MPIPRVAASLVLVSGLAFLSGSTAVIRAEVPAPDAAVVIAFEATVGGVPFRCGQSFDGVGTTKSSITATDFRLFISNVRLVTRAGQAVPLALTQDGKWQSGSVALLDFEDGSGGCANGTPDLRSTVEGTAPDGEYVGLTFDVGLPFEVNHRDPTLAPSPLNLTRLFWNWTAGYKFTRIDLRTTGQPRGWMLHLGSTDCSPRQGPTSVPVECEHPNRPTIAFASFAASRQVVRFDLADMLAEANLDENQPETASGCMSAATDRDCHPIFKALGLPFDGKPAVAQRAFSIVTRASASDSGGR
jgi:uncharacterized repeat protein (TIGR04052 family)